MRKIHVFILLVIGVLALSACAKSADQMGVIRDASSEDISGDSMAVAESDPFDTSMEDTPNDVLLDPTPEEIIQSNDEAMVETEESMVDPVVHDASMIPNWFSVSLIDVNSGEAFKVEDFEGRVVLVETMAMWCSTCLRQQKEVVQLHVLLNDTDAFVSLTLDIDPNEKAEDLQTYMQNQGFFWTYVISPAEVSREIAALYGDGFLNPPSAPMFVVDAEGDVHPLRFGVKDANELLETLQPFLEEAM
jgi:hypothetical protein